MKKIVERAPTVEEAVEKVVKKYGLGEGEYTVNVLEKGFHGIFGLFSKEAVVEVQITKAYFERKLKEFLTEILQVVDSEVKITVKSSGRSFFVDVESENVGRLIGKHGKTMGALQHIAMIFLNRLSDTKLNVILDMGDYREKRKKSLEKIVEEAVKKAISEKTKVVLDPMFSFERKIVHKLVRKHRGVISYSVGVEPYRRVVIEYSGTRREGRRKHDIKESI
ncbi:MAG: Single-stranded nucleic acid binding R3H domain protein [Thermotoga sp. 47_83]|jgi:spoIIIJ-associated protein|uniref:RNA-binding protein KhpB n=2 Tax=Thermotoga petrophila TaxID=93929 RepID=A5IMC5_THEP1|nr:MULTISPECIES: RNA-binding cell elongation regulator Jag/EloR [Thermotoga]KUK32825.1 MAG: Single-stranded nucleic acid binding R3H domain protein [Thermotoga sp. 47_83]MBZ4661267.1 single-stranded nucleic acid binding protein [Thermotoga sp.]HAA82753.1 protein jag [Thermotoga petrophila]ABQ47348.1 single-stranded nucleic acid binding R3H domain protein [Thermotoga petrophila RKU-1]ACB09696.1 single-stranded nucleic acid binding R3H domain protein [Thermotoga sp. RQ2]